MIFVTVGTHEQPFNRLIEFIDNLKRDGKIQEEVIMQTGFSTYEPKYCKWSKLLPYDEMIKNTEDASIVITHGGTGAIIGAVKKGKKVIAVPRLAKYGEHVDDHQLQLVKQFDDLNLICPCGDTNELAEAIETVKHTEYSEYESNTNTIVKSIENYIETLRR